MLRTALSDDLARAADLEPSVVSESGAAFILPDAAWSRRISGFFSNQLANAVPMRAHAVLTVRAGGYLVSVRAPASIQLLPEADLPRFLAAFEKAWPGRS